ncbi:MAG: hypothetical protein OEY50_10650 [Nitrospinota bacterium]|nr:hypothetical protein [Nitrospinota bacterium]MDH5755614.1 hypothetical protein [Nitrospinota bacterium]
MTEVKSGWKQDFFDRVEPILLKDPLAWTLGAVEEDAAIEYRFEDCVRLAGHACVSVASAFMMAKHGLAALYPDDVPVRGQVEVRFAGGRTNGANGPIGQVIGYITGAATETGFHGLAGKYGRDNLFTYDETLESQPGFITARFRRKDTGAEVEVRAEPSRIPMTQEEMAGSAFMPQVIQGTANREEKEAFFKFWQGRNRTLLLDNPEGAIVVKRL